jgi:hypothetical protein
MIGDEDPRAIFKGAANPSIPANSVPARAKRRSRDGKLVERCKRYWTALHALSGQMRWMS